MSKSIKRNAFGIAIATLVVGGTVVAAAAPSYADPSGFRDIVAVGSNTSEALYNGFGNGYTIGSTTYTPSSVNAVAGDVASYDATGTSPIQTRSGGPSFTRPNGSGPGRQALSAAWNSSNHVYSGTTLSSADVTIARSSSVPSTATAYSALHPSNEVFVPDARDAVGLAVASSLGISGNVIKSGTVIALFGGSSSTITNNASGGFTSGNYHQNASASVYTVGDVIRASGSAALPEIVTAVNGSGAITGHVDSINPTLPQNGSGTRSFFLSAIGASSSFGSWVTDSTDEENTPTLITNGTNRVAPYSGAAAVEQNNGLEPSTGLSSLNFPTIDSLTLFTGTGTSAAAGTLYGTASVNPASSSNLFDRDVYSVVANSALTATYDGDTLQDIVDNVLPGLQDKTGTGHKAVSTDYGFEALDNSYTTNTTNWYQNAWEN